ncbi:hypothetical protein KI387_018788 [Taxus chinensis]|uniref:Arogenate dehydratase n=1 Tax=Taxus chinensis TaxID=29808 RepID=A0AA38G586_TAXCH|nr:hypothetical protein KI387_018788 [Taxus chinensis]
MDRLCRAPINSSLWNIRTKVKPTPEIRSRDLPFNKPSATVLVSASNGANGGNGAINIKHISEQKDRLLLTAVKRALYTTEQEQGPGQVAFRVAYQGIPGAYSEEAALATHPGCQGLPCHTYAAALQSVESRVADRAILPVESTVEGSIHRNYDLLLDHRLCIVGEIHYPVYYCLLAPPGVDREEIKRVMAHPLALSQCRRTLKTLGLANVSMQTSDDTAGAAECVSRNGPRGTAAIASARAAEIYGLRVLARGIQDESCNFTRFLILARDPIVPTADRPCKTSIVVAHDGELGVLFKVLSAFSFRDINLTKLESRPTKNRPLRVVGDGPAFVKEFHCVFYIDFEASLSDRRVQNALTELKEFASFLRVLGSYSVDATPKA